MGPLVLLSLFILSSAAFLGTRFLPVPLSLPFSVQLGATICLGIFFIVGYVAFWQAYLKHDVGTSVISTGPYALVRHPLYSIMALTLPGIVLVWFNDALFILSWLLLILIVYRIVKVEERYMIERFGDEYLAYMRKVPAIIPWRTRE